MAFFSISGQNVGSECFKETSPIGVSFKQSETVLNGIIEIVYENAIVKTS